MDFKKRRKLKEYKRRSGAEVKDGIGSSRIWEFVPFSKMGFDFHVNVK